MYIYIVFITPSFSHRTLQFHQLISQDSRAICLARRVGYLDHIHGDSSKRIRPPAARP